MKLHSTVQNLGLSKIVEVSEAARLVAPEYERRTGRPFIYFQRGEVGFPTPAYVVEALNEAIQKGLTKYPKSGGEPWFKEAVIRYLGSRGIPDLQPDHVVCTAGGQEALQLVFSGYRGCRVTGFTPIWPCMLDNIFPYSEACFDPISLSARDGFRIPFDEVERKVRCADLFYLNTPHNPTGKVFGAEEVERLCDLCRKYNVLLVSDEAYMDLVFDGRQHVSPLQFPATRVYAAFTFSKTFAATGFRVGYAVCRDPDLMGHITRAEYTQTAGVPTPMQYAFARGLSADEPRRQWLNAYVGELQARRDLLRQRLAAHAPGGAFYYFLDLNDRLPKLPDRDHYLQEMFMKEGIAVVPGSGFGSEYSGYVRLSYSTLNREQLEEGGRRFTDVMSRMQ